MAILLAFFHVPKSDLLHTNQGMLRDLSPTVDPRLPEYGEGLQAFLLMIIDKDSDEAPYSRHPKGSATEYIDGNLRILKFKASNQYKNKKTATYS